MIVLQSAAGSSPDSAPTVCPACVFVSVLVFGMVKINGDLSATKWEILKVRLMTES